MVHFQELQAGLIDLVGTQKYTIKESMFSGIVSAIGVVEEVVPLGTTDMVARISTQNKLVLDRLAAGSSILCAGVCLTVVDIETEYFLVNISRATLCATNLRLWVHGTKINLENALRVGDPLDGHMVQGHIDCIGKVYSVTKVDSSHVMEIRCDQSISKLVAAKCSVTLDGVSLTVNSQRPGSFSVNLIPYTWTHTTLQYANVGDEINVETDLVARYLANLLPKRS